MPRFVKQAYGQRLTETGQETKTTALLVFVWKEEE